MPKHVDPEIRGFSLVAHSTNPEPGASMGLDFVRSIEESELEELQGAMALVQSLAGVTAYARLVDIFLGLREALEEINRPDPAPAQIEGVNRLALGVVVALRQLSVQLAEQLAGFNPGQEPLDVFERSIAEAERQLPVRVALAAETALKRGRGRIDPKGDNTSAQLVLDSAEVQPIEEAVGRGLPRPLPILSLLAGAVLVGQRLMAEQLVLLDDRVRQAVVLLRKTASEVLGGWPTLLEHRVDEQGQVQLSSDGQEETLNVTPHHLPMQEAERLAEALVRTERMTSRPWPTWSFNDADDQPDLDVPLTDLGELDGEEPSADDRDSETEPEAEEQLPPEEAARSEVTADLGALIDHVVRLSDDLERVWSDALQPEPLGEAHERLRAEWSSVSAVLQRRSEAATRALKAAGVDPKLRVHPLDPAQIHELELDYQGGEAWKQLQVAELLLLTQLLQAMNGLFEPSAQQVIIDDDDQPTETSWWEAGAFELVRKRAGALIRVSQELEAAENQATGQPSSEHASAWLDRLGRARQAIDYGDAEAGLLHLGLALRESAAQASGQPIENLPGEFLTRLMNLPQSLEARPHLELMSEVERRLLTGRPPGQGLLQPLAFLAFDPVWRLCHALTSEMVEEARELDLDADGS